MEKAPCTHAPGKPKENPTSTGWSVTPPSTQMPYCSDSDRCTVSARLDHLAPYARQSPCVLGTLCEERRIKHGDRLIRRTSGGRPGVKMPDARPPVRVSRAVNSSVTYLARSTYDREIADVGLHRQLPSRQRRQPPLQTFRRQLHDCVPQSTG